LADSDEKAKIAKCQYGKSGRGAQEERRKSAGRAQEERRKSEIQRVIKIEVLHFKKKEVILNLIHFD